MTYVHHTAPSRVTLSKTDRAIPLHRILEAFLLDSHLMSTPDVAPCDLTMSCIYHIFTIVLAALQEKPKSKHEDRGTVSCFETRIEDRIKALQAGLVL